MPGAEIKVLDGEAVSPVTLKALVDAWFGDMVKYVVDVEKRVIALGGELHADAEALP